MRSSLLRRLIVLGAILALPVTGYAQEAVLSGTVTDTTGGVLPGVTITAVHEASGNTFEAVTDERGAYRLPVRPGVYRITAQLQGFTTVTRTGLELLVGQETRITLQMSPGGVQESVTVTGEAPLIDVTQSRVSGNVDPRQMQDLPVNGRNWQSLTILAPGARTNAGSDNPVAKDTGGAFQINMDGQEVTNTMTAGSSFGQPRYSRDAIAEFEFVANRFDATQGRSSGVQVNAITKSGTNTLSGLLSGYFRDDSMTAANFFTGTVLPYSDQQVSGTFGGPIRKDKVHYFLYYETERQPQTLVFNSAYPRFNLNQTFVRHDKLGGTRMDFQSSPATRLMVRGNFSNLSPFPLDGSGGATVHPSSILTQGRYMTELFASLTQVLSNRTLNELKGGYSGYYWRQESVVEWAGPAAFQGVTHTAPIIQFRGYTVGPTNNTNPQKIGQERYSVRDDVTTSFNKGGRHDVKLGGEYIYTFQWLNNFRNAAGTIDAQGGNIPANVEDLFPVWNDPRTWNLAAVTSITRRYTLGVGTFRYNVPRRTYGAWVQDDWKVTPRLTLNLGVRYDLATNAVGEHVLLLPFLLTTRSAEKNRVGPRLGFALSLNDRTVIRGGAGKFYADVNSNTSHQIQGHIRIADMERLPDGRANFAANPFNGPIPTYEQAKAGLCSTALTATCLRLNIPSGMLNPFFQFSYSYQASVGVQRQIGNTMSFEADYNYTGDRQNIFSRNINLAYNPATGVNYPFTDLTKRPYPDWGTVTGSSSDAWGNFNGLSTVLTKRMSQNWQASATYLLSVYRDGTPAPRADWQLPATAPGNLLMNVAPDLGYDYGLATTDQRHRVVFNGIWQLGYGVQLSGLYLFGSGQRFATTYGGDQRNVGASGQNLARPDGTVVPRNNFVGKPIHRTSLRVQRRFSLGGRMGVDGILEVYNLFNHKNYGSYNTQEVSPTYGQPQSVTSIDYQPRMVQLGFVFRF